jgi:AraC family ethanolamine operon transcriptional activator
LRQLNIVRRALRNKLADQHNVSDIMKEHNIKEFGRFSSEYKALFGESPSETRRRNAGSAAITEKPR